jgi:hypothetical protein
VGYPGKAYSLSGKYSYSGKYLMILVSLLGKNRGLPSPRDRVIDFHFPELIYSLEMCEASVRGESTENMTKGIKLSNLSPFHNSTTSTFTDLEE